jgi:hypothetical protein
LLEDERLNAASEILDLMKCVPIEHFSRVELDFLERMEGALFISEAQLDWLTKIRDKHE